MTDATSPERSRRYRQRLQAEAAEARALRERVKFLERTLAEYGYIEDEFSDGTPYWRPATAQDFII